MAEDCRLDLTEGRFGFSHAGVAGSSMLVEASEDGGLADWTPVSTHTLSPQGRAQFTEARRPIGRGGSTGCVFRSRGRACHPASPD